MAKKYKAWGSFKCQTVRPSKCLSGSLKTGGRPISVIVREGDNSISVTRHEIPSLIQALLEIGELK